MGIQFRPRGALHTHNRLTGTWSALHDEDAGQRFLNESVLICLECGKYVAEGTIPSTRANEFHELFVDIWLHNRVFDPEVKSSKVRDSAARKLPWIALAPEVLDDKSHAPGVSIGRLEKTLHVSIGEQTIQDHQIFRNRITKAGPPPDEILGPVRGYRAA